MSHKKAAFEWGARGSGCVGSREKYSSKLQRKEKILLLPLINISSLSSGIEGANRTGRR